MKGKKLVSKTLDEACLLKDEAELKEFVETMGVACIAIMRGMYGNDYAEGYLKCALSDKDPLIIKPKMREAAHGTRH